MSNESVCAVCGRPAQYIFAFPSGETDTGVVYDGAPVCSPECAQKVERQSTGKPRRRYSTFALEEALELWRGAWKQIHGLSMPPEWRRDYELATEAIELVGLHQCRTIQDLLRMYYDGEKQLEPAIRGATNGAAENGRLLNHGLVEDGAFWRKYCTLVRRAVDLPDKSPE